MEVDVVNVVSNVIVGVFFERESIFLIEEGDGVVL